MSFNSIYDPFRRKHIAILNKQFDKEFIELARSVYIINDKRAICKKEINIFNCPTHLYARFVAFTFAIDFDRTKFPCTLSRVVQSRNIRTKRRSSAQTLSIGMSAKTNEEWRDIFITALLGSRGC